MKTALAFGALFAGVVSLVSTYDVAFNESDWLDSLREALGRPPLSEADTRLREIALGAGTGFTALLLGATALRGRRS